MLFLAETKQKEKLFLEHDKKKKITLDSFWGIRKSRVGTKRALQM